MKIPAFLKAVLALVMFLPVQGLIPASARAQDASGTVILPVVAGKDIRFTVFTGAEGLASGNVYGITQDAKGFLWFATDDGLSRYDGYSFRTFHFERGNANSPSSSSIQAIAPGRNDTLWLATTSGGIDRFDLITETFTHYRHDPNSTNSLSGYGIHTDCLLEDRQGVLWIGTQNNGLNRLDPATGVFTHYRHSPEEANSLSSDRIECIDQDSSGMMWIGTSDAGLNRLDPVSGKITRYLPNPADPHALPGAQVNGMYEDRTGAFWVATSAGFGVLDRPSGGFTRYAIAPDHPDASRLNKIVEFHEDAAGNLWLGSGGAGMLKLDRQQRRVVMYRNDPGNPHSLRNNFVRSFQEDPSGTLWVGTLGGGANAFSVRPPKFAHYQAEPDNPNSVADNFIFSLFEDHAGIVWIGTSRTLNRWDRQSNTWQVYRNDPSDPASISTGSVTATQEDPDGTLWFGTFRRGLNRFDPKTGRFKAYLFDAAAPHSLGDDIVRSLFRDSNGVLWVGGWNNGLNRFDRTTETFQRYTHDPDNPNSLSRNRITDIYEDRAKTLWVATEGGGLNRFDPATQTFKRFRNDPQNLASLANDDVRVLCEDRSGQFWVGTAGGLCLFDRASGSCTVYTEKEGLPNNTIEGILEDEEGNLWISTNNGLSRFTPKTRTFRNYDMSDGLQSNEFHVFTAFCKSSRTGEMYFGGPNGFNVFDPRRVADNPAKPPVVITDFRLFGKSVPVGGASVLTKTINDIDRLTLPHNQNRLSFEFAALSYVAPAKNQYRYKLEGFDAEWRKVNAKERLAVYTGLPAGAYVFRVQGSNEDGVWNEDGKSIAITIIPPWWQTWWFRSAVAVALLGLVVVAYRIRVRRLEQRSRNLERLVAERTRQLESAKEAAEAASRAKSEFLSSMSHELRTPLNAILGYTQILAQQDNLTARQHQQLDVMHASGEHLLMLISDILDLSRIEARRLELVESPFRLPQLLEQAMEITKVKAEQKHLALLHEADPALPECVRGDERRVRQILLNLLSNAVKFTQQGSVTLRVHYDQTNGGTLQCEVADTGIGIANEKLEAVFEPFIQLSPEGQGREGVGLGLTITRRLAALMGGTVTVASQPGQGSTFRFSAPLPRATATEEVAELARHQIRGYRGPRRLVLVADDNPTNVGLLVAILEPLGFEVQTARNGRDALQQAMERPPDLVLLDLVMPEMDGVEAARKMRQLPQLAATRIVGISATVTSSERKQAFTAACDGFLGKPIQVQELLRTMERLLQIEWDIPSADPTPPTGDVSLGENAVPPAAVLGALQRAVERGEFGELERLLNQQVADGAYTGFCQQIRRLAARYDDEGIAAYLDRIQKAP